IDEMDPCLHEEDLGSGLTGYVLRSGQPLLVNPESFEALVTQGTVQLVGEPSLDWLGVPLKAGDRTIGVLVVQTYTEKVRFSEKDKEVLTFVSQHIATALERKQSHDAIRQAETRLRALVGSIDETVFEFDSEGTYLNIWTTNEALLVAPKY